MTQIRPTTSEIMEIFSGAQKSVEEVRKTIEEYRTAAERKLSILNEQIPYALSSLDAIRIQDSEAPGRIMLAREEKRGEYDSYGLTVHPKLIKTPRDIFNLRTTTGYIFKDNVSVFVNGEENKELRESLKHDSIDGKLFSIQSYFTDILEIEIVPEKAKGLGSLNMNMIEIEPFLPGSFNIEAIDLYSAASGSLPEQSIAAMNRVGSQRVVFDMKTDLVKAVLTVRLLHKNSSGKYPFGLKHLYFCEADFRDDSYIVTRINKDAPITYIYDTASIRSQFGTEAEANCDEAGISFYTEYSTNAGLSHKIELSSVTSPSYIAINIHTCFMRMDIRTALISVTPDIRTSEN